MAHKDLVTWLKTQLDDKEFKWLFIHKDTTQQYMAMIYECREASLITFDGYILLQSTLRYGLTPQGEIALGIVATDTPDGSRAIGNEAIGERDVVGTGAGLYLPCTFCNTLTVSRETLTCTQCDAHYGDEDFEPATPQPDSQPADSGGEDVTYVREWNSGISPDGVAFVSGETAHLHYHFDMRTDEHADNLSAALDTYADTTAALRSENARLQADVTSRGEQNARLQGELATARAAIRDMDTMQDRIDDLNQMVDEARQERDKARERVEELEDVIKEAYRIATDTGYETPQLCLGYVIAELREASTD